MKTISALTGGVRGRFTRLRQQRFFSDKLSVGLLIAALSLNLINLIILAVKLRPLEFSTSIPVHYSNLNNGFDVLGPWYLNYRIGLFALAVTIVNSYLAIQSYSKSRITSFYLMTGAVVVGIFCVIISAAFTVIL